jgi:DNA-directed RNA polymerase specialized sigma24 family protein
MKKKWNLSREAFDALLNWLHEDREKAGEKYEEIRQRLVKFFVARGCADAEDLADETINRVTNRVEEIKKDFTGDPLKYFYGVANMVYKEVLRRPEPPSLPPPPDSSQIEMEYGCLEKCINRLTPKNRALLLQYYYPQEGCSLSEQRRLLAERLDIAPNALRIRAFRIRAWLQKCVEKCVARSIE